MLHGRFLETLRRRGPAMSRWPTSERRAALLLLRVSPAARRLLADAVEYPGSASRDDLALVRMQAGLRRRMPRAAAPETARPPLRWAALAACAVAGIWLGSGSAEQSDARDVLAVLQIAPIGQVEQ